MKKKINFFILVVLILFLTLIFFKIIDLYFFKHYGLGRPVLYLSSYKHGYIIKPNQKIVRRNNEIIINNRGMRNEDNWKEGSNNYKIIFFGGSVTYGGSVVSNKDLFTKKVCEFLNNKSANFFLCGNYGVNGYNLESITRLIKFRKITDENFIVVTIVGNDLSRVFHNIASQPFWNNDVPTFFPAFTEILFIFLENLKNKVKYNFSESGYSISKDEEYYKYLIKNFRNALDESGKKYIIFYSPESSEVFYERHKKNDYIKFLLKNNLKNFYDLSEDLAKYEVNNIFHDGVHYNQKGHQILGEIIAFKIKNLIK